VKRVMRSQFVIPPTRGPMNAALAKDPHSAVGATGITLGEMFM
jgi:hypothetical protein